MSLTIWTITRQHEQEVRNVRRSTDWECVTWRYQWTSQLFAGLRIAEFEKSNIYKYNTEALSICLACLFLSLTSPLSQLSPLCQTRRLLCCSLTVLKSHFPTVAALSPPTGSNQWNCTGPSSHPDTLNTVLSLVLWIPPPPPLFFLSVSFSECPSSLLDSWSVFIKLSLSSAGWLLKCQTRAR